MPDMLINTSASKNAEYTILASSTTPSAAPIIIADSTKNETN